MTGCKKEEPAAVPPATWFSKYHYFHYDCSRDTQNIPDYRILSVIDDPSTQDAVFFYEHPGDTSASSWEQTFGFFGNGTFINKTDGLYQQACTDCGAGLLCWTFDYLAIPANVQSGDAVQLYGCGHKEHGRNQIVNTDTIINVPAGTYHTFCILHPGGDKSYWNRDIGIIMYEQYEHDLSQPFKLLATLKLRSMN